MKQMKTILLPLLMILGFSSALQEEKYPSSVYLPVVYFQPNSLKLLSFDFDMGYSTDTTLLFDTLVTILNGMLQNFKIELAGHQDFSEKDSLAIKRAEKVGRILISKGLDSKRLALLDFKDTKPRCESRNIDGLNEEDLSECRQRNSRVVLIIGSEIK